jgi:outer membrane lipoprotein carrier protein
MSELRRSSRVWLFLLFPLLLFASSVTASTGSPAEVVAWVQQRYSRLHSLEFDFSQRTQSTGRIREGRGQATFYRQTPKTESATTTDGSVIRWNYHAPNEQIIVNDGHEISIYTPEDKQLLVTPASDMETDVTFSLFTGARGLQDEFTADPEDPLFLLSPSRLGSLSVLLTPKRPQSQVKRIQLWLDDSHNIQRILMEDHFGALTELTFTNIRFNGLPADDTDQAKALRQIETSTDTETIRQ